MFDVSRYKDLEYLAIMEARNDSTFKSELLKPNNAKTAIERRFKVKLPDKVGVNVLEDQKDQFTIVLPNDDVDKMSEKWDTNTYW